MHNLEYKIRRNKRAKRLRLTVCCDAQVVVTIPNKYDLGIVERFINEKIAWITEKVEYFKSRNQLSFAGGSHEQYLEYKEVARKLVTERLAYFNTFYGFKYNRISIRNQKTRWGSCSRRGNLNFNFKLALLPQHCADYIIIHELCHIGELNHSKRFWNLVEKTCPNHRQIVAEIRNLGN